MVKRPHNFITYYNPRNGRVSIQACEKCGLAKGLELAQRHCDRSGAKVNKMHLAGWSEQHPVKRLGAAA